MPEAAHDDDPIGAFRLEGQVIDEHEQPVAGAEVGIDANPPKVVKSDASGAFVFEGLIARAYAVEARADAGYAGPVRVRLGAKPEPVTLRLHAGGSVEVAVTDGTAPIANAAVELRATVLWTATTNAAGVATFSHVGAEWAPLVASAPGFAPAAMMLGTSGDPKAPVRVALVLARGAAVSGMVVDGAGKPVGGARVVATPSSIRVATVWSRSPTARSSSPRSARARGGSPQPTRRTVRRRARRSRSTARTRRPA